MIPDICLLLSRNYPFVNKSSTYPQPHEICQVLFTCCYILLPLFKYSTKSIFLDTGDATRYSVDSRCQPRQSAARIPQADNGTPFMAEPKWPLAFCQISQRRGTAKGFFKRNHRPFSGRIGTFRDRAGYRPRRKNMV